jgi:serine/threonine protein kinase
MKKVGRYEIIEELGQGAMGAVYKARDPMMDRVVAVKTILASALMGPLANDYRERFFREARAAGRLAHPGIVTVYDVSEEDGTPFLVMELIDGRTLEKLLETGERFDAERVMEMGQQLAEALDYAHKGGVIHRDIKPANIMVTADGRPKITDFGVAKLTAAQVTSTGQLMGTPAFMAPEQFTGAPIDGRADLFALGVMLYWLATGDRPFTGETLMAMSYKIVHTEPVPPRKINPAIPRDLENVILKCMEKDPADRYLNGEALARDLRTMREGRGLDTLNRERAGRDIEKTALSAAPPLAEAGELDDELDAAETVAVNQPKSRTGSDSSPGIRAGAAAPSKSQATLAVPQKTVSAAAPESESTKRAMWLVFAAVVVVALVAAAMLKKRESSLPSPQAQQQVQPGQQTAGGPTAGQVPTPPAPVEVPPDVQKLQADAEKAAEETRKETAKISPKAKHTVAAKPMSGLQVELTATERVSVVLTEDSKPAAAYQLQPGNSVTATAENEMRLVTDNAGAIHWKLNGKEQSPLGSERKGVSVRITAAGAELLWTGNPASKSKVFGIPLGAGLGATGAQEELGVVDPARVRSNVNKQLSTTMTLLKIETRVPAVLEVMVQMDGKPLIRRGTMKKTAAGVEVERGAVARWVPPGKHEFAVLVLRPEARGRWTHSASGEFVAGQPRTLHIEMVTLNRLSVELR